MINIEEMKKRRFQFLRRLYELTGGDRSKLYDYLNIGEELGFDRELTSNIVEYLVGEGLIESQAYGHFGITHLGVREVEEALSNPNKPTSHFPPVNIIHIGQMINSQIQQASPDSTQVVTIGEEKNEEVKEVLQSLKKSIDQLGLNLQQKSDLQAEIQTIEAQVSSSKPKADIIAICRDSIIRILEGASGGVIAFKFIEILRNLKVF